MGNIKTSEKYLEKAKLETISIIIIQLLQGYT